MKQTTKAIAGVAALLVIAGGAVVAAAWAGRDEEKKVEAQAKHDRLFDFDKKHVLVIDLIQPGNLVQVARDTPTSPWRLTQPTQAAGDDLKINQVLDAFNRIIQKRDLGDDHNLKAYGLEHSRIIAKVVFDNGKEEGLEFGVENSFDHGIYVKKLGEDTVRVLDTWEKNPFDKSAYDMRNKKVAELPETAEIRRLEVSGNQTPYVLEKDGSQWRVDGSPADSETIERLAMYLKNLRFTNVPAEDFSLAMPHEFALDPPQLTLKIEAVNGHEAYSRTILFSPPRPGINNGPAIAYAKRADEKPVYELENLIVNEFDKSPADFADKQLVHAKSDEVAKLTFESKGSNVTITRTRANNEDQFAVVAPKPGPANKVRLSAALFSLVNLRATAIEGKLPKQLAKYGLDKPMVATLLGQGDKVLARVNVGSLNKEGKQRYVNVEGSDKVALVEKGVVEDLPWTVSSALEVASK